MTDEPDEVPAADEIVEREGTPPLPHLVDAVADELALARAQIDAGLPGLGEGTLRRRLARLEAEDADAGADEADALQLLLAEALWRQQRPVAARTALNAIPAASTRRRLPMAMLIEAETLAAFGESDRAAGAQERLLAAIGGDAAFELRAGTPGLLSWPLPAEMAAEPVGERRPPWGAREPSDGDAPPAPGRDTDEQRDTARRTLEEARVAYVDGQRDRGDDKVTLAVRLDDRLAADGVSLIEPTLGRQPPSGRLVLYGDLLRAAGREEEAQRAYRRAAERRT